MLGNRQIKKNDIGDDVGMEIKITNKSFMMIFLLEECNNSCFHCVRKEEPMSPGYKLTFKQLKTCLLDCQKLETIEWIHFSGGEPTLWSEGKLDLADLLIEISNAGFDPGFTTNGIIIADYKKCSKLFKKYLDNASNMLRLYFTIDTFHNNFDTEKGRAECLDNFLKFKETLLPEKKEQIKLTMLTVISKDPGSLLPDDMVAHYKSLGVNQYFLPFQLKGKGKAYPHLAPDLSSEKQEDLGAYYRFRPKQIQKKSNDTSDNMVLIGNHYYFHKPRWRKVARLGHLPEKVINAYLEGNEDVKD